MTWEHWPYPPKSLTDMVGPDTDPVDNERFISLLISGCSERMSRALTVLEPDIDADGYVIYESDPADRGRMRQKLRRIDPVNPRQNFAGFCKTLRDYQEQDLRCQAADFEKAHFIIKGIMNSSLNGKNPFPYPCWMGLGDMGMAIFYQDIPVAVALSGQFAPGTPEEAAEICIMVQDMSTRGKWPQAHCDALLTEAGKLVSRTQFTDEFKRRRKEQGRSELNHNDPDALFIDAVKEISNIASAEFQMHKRRKEGDFFGKLRKDLQQLLADKFPHEQITREGLAKQIRPILDEVRTFCSTDYLVLFISPRQYVSYESKPNLLTPFAATGLDDETAGAIQHFNWRKASRIDENDPHMQNLRAHDEELFVHAPLQIIGHPENLENVKRAIAFTGGRSHVLNSASLVYPVELSDLYRAVLVWGPFEHLEGPTQHPEEFVFLRDASEMIMTRVLSLAQLADSEEQIRMWGTVAGLLAHHSRRAVTPVSSGVSIIDDFLKGGEIYSREDALNACASLAVVAKVVAGAVRVPLLSFAAMAENVYQFRSVDLTDIITARAKMYLPVARRKKVKIKIEPSIYQLPPVEADEEKLADAIGYVIDNAVKYSHDEKEVRIYAEIQSAQIQIVVEDFGLGIKPDDSQRIYERGRQGERSRKSESEEGEGLGLYHAKLIIEAHKGHIRHTSYSGSRTGDSAKLEGYVVRFTIELPIRQANGSPAG